MGYIPEIMQVNFLKHQLFNLGESQKTWSWFLIPRYSCQRFTVHYFVLHIHPVKISHHHSPLVLKGDLALLSAVSIIVFILSAEIWWFISSAQTKFSLSILPCSSVKKVHAKYTYLYLEHIVHLEISLHSKPVVITGLNYRLLLLNTSSFSKLPC